MHMYLNFDTGHLLKIKVHKLPRISLIRLILGEELICKTSIINQRGLSKLKLGRLRACHGTGHTQESLVVVVASLTIKKIRVIVYQPIPIDELDYPQQEMFSAEGEKWRRLRNILSPSFSSRRMKEVGHLCQYS